MFLCGVTMECLDTGRKKRESEFTSTEKNDIYSMSKIIVVAENLPLSEPINKGDTVIMICGKLDKPFEFVSNDSAFQFDRSIKGHEFTTKPQSDLKKSIN